MVTGRRVGEDDPTPPVRRSRFGVLRVLAVAVVLVLVVTGGGFGLLMMRLSDGPIRLDWLGQRIAASLAARTDNHYAFDLGATQVARSAHGPTLVIDDFRVRAGSQTIVEAPHAEISIDLVALLTGEVRPRRLSVSNIDINLVVLPNGAISIASGQKGAPIAVTTAPLPSKTAEPGERPVRAALLAQAGAALRGFFDLATAPGGAIGLVERVGVSSGRLIVEDQTADRTTTFDDLDIAFDKLTARTDLSVRAKGPNGPVSLTAHARGVPGAERTIEIGVKDISIDEVILAGGIRHPNFDSDMKLAASMTVALEPGGAVREARATFGLGSGYVRLDDPDHEPYFIDEVSGSAHWDAATRSIVVEPTHLFASDTRITVAGAIEAPPKGEEGWHARLGLAEPGTLSPERPGETILRIADLGFDAAIHPFAQQATLTRAIIKGPDLDVSLAGSMDWSQGLRIRFTGEAGQGPLRALLRVWPSHVAASVRGWLIGHTHGGTVRSATMSADYDAHAILMMRYGLPPPDKTLTMDFTIANGSVDTLSGLAPMTGLDATVHLTGRTMRLDARAGVLDVSPGRRFTLAEGSLVMPRNDGAGAVPAHLSVRAAGSAEAAAELLSKDAIKGSMQFPLDPSTLHGKLDGRVDVDFEIGPEAQPTQTTVEATVNANDLVVDKLIGKEKLDAGAVAINVDATGLKASGTGRIFGGPMSFDLRKPTGQPVTVQAALTLDEAARAKAGFALSGVTGPIAAKIAATIGDSMRAQVDLDLTRAGLENGIPGLVKPAGKPAKLSFVLDQKTGGAVLDQVTFEGGGATARGTVDLAPDGGFQNARFSQMKLSTGDDFRADIQKGSDGIKIAVRAAAIDARPFLKFVTQPGTSAPGVGGDFDLDLKAPIVSGFGKQVLSNVDLKIVRRASVIRQFAMTGGFGRRPVVIEMVRGENSAPQISVTTPDAGALLAFTDVYPRMEGGALSALMQLDTGRVTGTIKVMKFALKDEPALRRLVIEGVPQQSAQPGKPTPRLDANQIGFDRLQAVFTHANGRLDIRDGLMNGPAVGLTVEGSIDDAHDALNLTGTYVPAYGINNLFAKIPVVGVFLGGGWNEGLFAVNYHVTGRPSAPVLNINPLSAVAPGFLRKLFGAIDGTGQLGIGEQGQGQGQGSAGRPGAGAGASGIGASDPSGQR